MLATVLRQARGSDRNRREAGGEIGFARTRRRRLKGSVGAGRQILDRRLTLPAAIVPFAQDGRERLPKSERIAAARPMTSSHSDDPDQSQEAVFRFLADPRTHGLAEPVGRVDTANAVVFLAGADVYKVKRAVKFPFMDLSTLDKRREACEAEIEVNRRSAPQIYLSALPITRQGATFALGGDGEIVEWVTHMRQFNENATLDRVADRGGVPDAIIDKLALAIRRSHTQAPLRDAARAAQALETYIEQNAAAFAERPDLFDPPTARKLTHDSRLAFAILRPVLLRRGEAGFVRRCHGDLHLRNIVLIDGEPTLFDAVEFSDEIASGDVLYDLAFLLMDLEERGLRAAANRLFNRYLAPEPPEALTGLVALPLFLSLRAAIRAKVEAAGAERLEGKKRDEARALARRYFDRAVQFLAYVPPRLVAVGGLSGVEKARSPARSRRRSAGRQARSGCAATSSARRCSRSRRPFVCRPGLTPATSRATSMSGSSTRPGSRFGRGRRSSSTRPSRPPPNAAPRPARRRRSASPSLDFFSTPLWRRALSASPPGAMMLRTPTPMWRADRRPSLSARKDGRRWRLRGA